MKKFITNFVVSVNVYSEIEANSIEEVRDLIKEELTDVNSYFTLPPLLNKTPDKQKYLNTQLHAIDTALCAEIENYKPWWGGEHKFSLETLFGENRDRPWSNTKLFSNNRTPRGWICEVKSLLDDDFASGKIVISNRPHPYLASPPGTVQDPLLRL